MVDDACVKLNFIHINICISAKFVTLHHHKSE